jgi:hypothetical protein
VKNFQKTLRKVPLSVTYHKCIANVTDSVTEKWLACIAFGNKACVVQVVCTFTTVASGRSFCHNQRLGDVVVVITVRAGKVETNHQTLCLADLRNVGQAYYQSA